MLRRNPLRPANAFAPGHVTGLFAPAASGPDPRARGSIGAGVVLELGVLATATFEPDRPRRIVVNAGKAVDLPISRTVAERLLGPRRGRLTVELRHQLPIGQGFGMSAAGALATALAVGDLLEAEPRRSIEVAHLADLFGGGGLGGVSAILGGGLEVRRTPGVPPRGTVRHYRFPPRIWIGVTGRPIPSPGLLRDPAFLERVSRAAEGGLRALGRSPSPRSFLLASGRFTDRLGLAPPSLRRLLDDLHGEGIGACQAMFGRSFFATTPTEPLRSRLVRMLRRHRVRAVELAAATEGAHLVGGGAALVRESLLNRS
jgi:pantoate kinase